MIVPMAFFQPMPDHAVCDNSMDVGEPVAADDGVARYIKSIVELRDAAGNIVGWVYLAQAPHGGGTAEYVQGNPSMSARDRTVLRVRVVSSPLTSLALLHGELPTDLTVMKCSVSRT